MRALLVGFGHTKRVKRFTTSANVSAGYSFNHLTVDSGVGPAFIGSGVSVLDVHVRDSGILKPEVAAWYDVFKHMGVGVAVAYLVSRPQEVMVTAAGSQTRRLRADTLELTAGVTFGLWKKK